MLLDYTLFALFPLSLLHPRHMFLIGNLFLGHGINLNKSTFALFNNFFISATIIKFLQLTNIIVISEEYRYLWECEWVS